MTSIRVSIAAVFLLAAAGAAFAQAYPSKLVKIVVPTAPGNAADITTRLVTERLIKRFGQPFIVENRPGGAATGALAAVAVAKSPADGTTLLMTSTSFTINTAMFAHLPYDVEKDFEPVALTGEVGMVLITAPDSPVKTVQELVDVVRKNPGKYNYAMVGRGSIQHLTMELFLSAIGGEMQAIPYKGSAPAMVDVMSGTVPFMFDALSSATPYVASGRVRGLAVGMQKRAAALPNVPAMPESGVPALKNFEVIGWVGLFAPKGTPKPIVDLLNESVMQIVNEKEIKDKLAIQGLEIPAPHAPEKFRDFLRDQITKWDAAARAAKIARE
ncbi:MAG TPA: tripartite tricarboxylate transporter substrate binding protein [Burkholderiales bacterium]|nr:tripartite tricarboxylate transporter substrate binding protein [Burkholderiales bacterium]